MSGVTDMDGTVRAEELIHCGFTPKLLESVTKEDLTARILSEPAVTSDDARWLFRRWGIKPPK